MPSIFTKYLKKRIKELAAGDTNNKESYPKARPRRPDESLSEWFDDRLKQLAKHSLVKPSQDETADLSD